MAALWYRDPVDGTWKQMGTGPGPALTPSGDYNACTTTGLYSIAGSATNGLPSGGGNTGGNLGVLQVFATDATHVTQVFFGGSNSAPQEIWSRSCNAGTWSQWDSVIGRIPALGSFALTGTNGLYSIAGTATGGPGITGGGLLTSWGNPIGVAGGQATTVQTWTSYFTGEIWQRQQSGSGYSAWRRVAATSDPLGEIAYTFSSGQVAGIGATGVHVVFFAAGSVQLRANRKYRITAGFRGVVGTVVNDIATFYLSIGGPAGNNIRESLVQITSTINGHGGGTIIGRYVPTADEQPEIGLNVVRVAGTGTITALAAGGGQTLQLLVEDMGQ